MRHLRFLLIPAVIAMTITLLNLSYYSHFRYVRPTAFVSSEVPGRSGPPQRVALAATIHTDETNIAPPPAPPPPHTSRVMLGCPPPHPGTATPGPVRHAPCGHKSGLCLIPQPVKAERILGAPSFQLSGATVLDATSVDESDGRYFQRKIGCSMGLPLTLLKHGATHTNPDSVIFLLQDSALPPDGYHLSVNTLLVRITYGDRGGLLYAFMTLLQLMSPSVFESVSGRARSEVWAITACVVTDKPRYRWRGLHLDSARHFFESVHIKGLLELMAIHKLNRFHWHLSDDQGWRIEIKRHPELALFGGRRGPSLNPPVLPSGNRFNGTAYPTPKFYTQDEIAEIVDYAKDLNIEVIPEIDIPAHTAALIIGARQAVPAVDLGVVQYPEFCPGDANSLTVAPNCMGGTDGIVIPDDLTVNFLKDVFEEVTQLFPSKYIHIGGDEAGDFRDAVYDTPRAQKVKAEKHIETNEGLQGYLADSMIKFLSSRGKTSIAWDDTFVGLAGYRPPEESVLMWWRSWATEASWETITALGYPLILTPSTHVYLDMFQMEPHEDSKYWVQRSTASLADAYDIGDFYHANVLGVEACAWSETFTDWAIVEYQLFPRLCAVAEAAWSSVEHRDFFAFLERLDFHKQRLDHMGIGYCKTDYTGADTAQDATK